MLERTTFGGILGRIQKARKHTYEQARQELIKRNKAYGPDYKMAETVAVTQGGTTTKEFRLYKLIDASVVTISADVNTEIQIGKQSLTEKRGYGSKTTK